MERTLPPTLGCGSLGPRYSGHILPFFVADHSLVPGGPSLCRWALALTDLPPACCVSCSHSCLPPSSWPVTSATCPPKAAPHHSLTSPLVMARQALIIARVFFLFFSVPPTGRSSCLLGQVHCPRVRTMPRTENVLRVLEKGAAAGRGSPTAQEVTCFVHRRDHIWGWGQDSGHDQSDQS